MENLGKLTVFVLIFVAAFFVSLLGAHVILKIGIMYDLKFITNFSFLQIYGIVCAFGVLNYRPVSKDNSEEKSFNQGMIKGFGHVATYAFFYLLSWFFAHIMYLIIS